MQQHQLSVIGAGLLMASLASDQTAVVAGVSPARLHVPKGWTFSLPAGDAEAGKEAFRKMECSNCHTVPGAEFPVARTSGRIGPPLVPAYSKLPREFLAEAILNPHKYMSGTLVHYRGLEEVSSEMRDYSSIMSVRELLDIVEFLKHLGDTPPPKP